MKKIIALILGIALIYSCSTSSDENSNSETNVGPVAPSNLTGTVASAIQINLSWTDNSTNETGFKIERKTGTGTYAIIGTTATDVTTFNDTGLTASTTYTYRVYSYNAGGNSPTYSNEITKSTTGVVLLSTIAVFSVGATTAQSGGIISNDGGAAITAKGICWSINSNPTIALTTKTTNGLGSLTYSSLMPLLNANTTYYVRAYVTNSLGTFYGNEIIFTTRQNSNILGIPSTNVTDIDGNVYQTVRICNQTWTTKNLNVSRYRNGDIIPQITDATQWSNLTTGAWCYNNNITSSGVIYGKLYNWYAVNDPRGLAPNGYHIPSDSEWSILINCLDPNGSVETNPITGQQGEELNVSGGAMKETGTLRWLNPNNGATNNSGFTALPSGVRVQDGRFGDSGSSSNFWSSSESGTMSAWGRWLYFSSDTALKANYESKKLGIQVRCVKD